MERPDLDQEGVAARRQLLAAGVTDGQIRARVADGRWQALHHGVYAMFSGPVSPRALVWAAVLCAGEGAVAGPAASLWLAGATDRLPARIDVLVPRGRRVRRGGAVCVRRRIALPEVTHPTARPPRLRVEEAVLDACGRLDRPDAVVDLVVRVVQRRLTATDRLLARLDVRSRQRWRALLGEVLADVDAGVRSALERRWVRAVQRPHGLPAGVLNRADDGGSGRRAYRDVEILEWGLVVELDGQESHPVEEAFRDRRRDNRVTVTGRRTLRYGWREIAGDACAVAAEVADVLISLGWPGSPGPCRPGCPVSPDGGRSSSSGDQDRPPSQ